MATLRCRQPFKRIVSAALLRLVCSWGYVCGASQEQKSISKAAPLVVDYDIPTSWRQALDRADVVAVVRLEAFEYSQYSDAKLPRTRFQAKVIEEITGSGSVSAGDTISISRLGGLLEVAGVSKLVEEAGFPPWSVRQTLLVFLTRSDQLGSYTLSFGPSAAFELDPATQKVRAFSKSSFAARQNGRDAPAVLAEVRTAAEGKLVALVSIAPNAVAISHRLWRERFSADPSVVSRSIRVGRQPFVVVGIAAPGFLDAHRGVPTDVWIPLPAQALVRGSAPDLRRFDDPRADLLGHLAGRLAPAPHAHPPRAS